MNMKNFWVDCMVRERESSHINYVLTVTSLLLSEQPESLSCYSDKSFTFLNNQGTHEILQIYSNLQHQMINTCSLVSIYILCEILYFFNDYLLLGEKYSTVILRLYLIIFFNCTLFFERHVKVILI